MPTNKKIRLTQPEYEYLLLKKDKSQEEISILDAFETDGEAVAWN